MGPAAPGARPDRRPAEHDEHRPPTGLPPPHQRFVQLRPRVWTRVLAGGLVSWAAASLAMVTTKDTILVPAVVLSGSFLVPVTVAAFVLSRQRAGYLTTEELITGFLVAGTVGLAATALAETYLVPGDPVGVGGVAIVEESGKAVVVLVAAHAVRGREPRDGMILGAIVGAGFAAFESTGYAFNEMFESSGDPRFYGVLRTVAVRAVLAPGAHIVWTALLAGAVFAALRDGGRARPARVAGTFAGVCLLHAAWDASDEVAVAMSRLVAGDGWHLVWAADPVHLRRETVLIGFTALYAGFLLANVTIGGTWVRRRWCADAPRPARAAG